MKKDWWKKAVLFFSLIILIFPQFPQGTISTPEVPHSWAIWMTKTSEDGSIEDGFPKSIALSPDNSFLVSYGRGDFSLTKVSQEGQVIWDRQIQVEKDYGGIEGNSPSSVVSLPDGGCALGNRKYIFRFSPDGNLLWAKSYEGFQEYWKDLEFSDLRLMPDGYLLGVGALDYTEVFVLKLNQEGNIVWGETLKAGFSVRPLLLPRSPSGYWLVTDSLGYGSSDQFMGIKLFALTSEGNVENCRIISDELQRTEPPSSYGGLESACISQNGDLFLAQTRYDGGFGVTFLRLGTNGESVRWAKWLGGDLLMGARGIFVNGGDQTPEGGAVFCGKTTEFTDYRGTWWNPFMIKISPEGNFDWIETIGEEEREGELAWPKALPDGSVVFAGNFQSLGSRRPALLVKATPDGNVSGLKGWLNWVEQEGANSFNPKIHIKTPEIFITPGFAGKTDLEARSAEVNCQVREGNTQIQIVEGPDTNVVFEPLYPLNSWEPSRVMQGGNLIRYYRLATLDGKELENADIFYYSSITGKGDRVKSGKGGEVAFTFKIDQDPGNYRTTTVITSIKKSGISYRTRGSLKFPLEVIPLNYGTNWTIGCGSSSKVGVPIAVAGPVSASLAGIFNQNGGMLINRTKSDPDRNFLDSLGINTLAKVGIGQELGLGFEHKGKLGPIQAEAPQATLTFEQALFQEITTLFPPPSKSSTREKWMEGFALLAGIGNLIAAGTIPGGVAATQLIAVILNALMAAIGENVQIKELLQGVELKLGTEANLLQLGLKTKAGDLKGIKIGNFEEEVTAELALNYYALENELGAKITVTVDTSLSVADLVGFTLGEWTPGITSFSLEVRVNPSEKKWTRTIFSLRQPPDNRGEIQALEFTIDREVLGNVADQLEQLTYFVDPSKSQGEFLITPQMISDLLEAILRILPRITIPYRLVVLQDEEPTEIDLSLGIEVEGAQIELGITPKFGRYQTYTLEEGVFVPLDKQLKIGRLVPFATYDTKLFKDQVDELPSMAWELLKAVGETLENAWDMVSGILSEISDLALDLGQDIWGGGKVIFKKGTDLISGLPEKDVVFASFQAQAAPKKNSEIRFGRMRVEDNPFIVGSLYFLEPQGKALSKPAQLTLSYSQESLKGTRPEDLNIYWLNQKSGLWQPLTGAVHDPELRTFTATISHLGIFCLGSDQSPPEFALVQDFGAEEVGPLPDLTIYCKENGSGLDPDSLNFTLDGKNIPFEIKGNTITPSLNQPLEDGGHRLEISGADYSGNRGNGRFSFKTFHPSEAPILKIQEGTEGVFLSWTPGKAGTYPIEKWVIKRSIPEAGIIFHPLAELDPTSQSFLDREIEPGETYAYFLQGLDSGGHNSFPSQVVRVKIPGQLQTPTPTPSQTPSSPGTPTATPSSTQSPTGQLPEGGKGVALWVPLLIIGILLSAGISAYLIFRRRKK